MIITAEEVESVLDAFFRRCQRVRDLGGIALRDVVNGDVVVPDGWILDPEMDHYLPSNVVVL